MVKIKLTPENAKVLHSKMTWVAASFPDETTKAVTQAASIIKRKMYKAVTELGSKDTGQFQPLSEMRGVLRGKKTPGGVLADSRLLKVQRDGGEFYCGYPSRMTGVFSAWQESRNIDLTNNVMRHRLHEILHFIGRKDFEIPYSGYQPKRYVVDPLAALASRKMPKWVLGAMNKLFDKKFGSDAIKSDSKFSDFRDLMEYKGKV